MIRYTNWIEDGENIFPLPENNLLQSQLNQYNIDIVTNMYFLIIDVMI